MAEGLRVDECFGQWVVGWVGKWLFGAPDGSTRPFKGHRGLVPIRLVALVAVRACVERERKSQDVSTGSVGA